jgi:Right handed beta helix region
MFKSSSPTLTRATALALVAVLATAAACSDDDDAAPSTTARRAARATTSTAPTTTAPPTTKAPTTQPPTTAAPSTQPPATADDGGFPGPSNTGVPPGTRLRPSGTVVVTEPGTVIEGLDITGTLDIRADDVEVRRTRIRTSGDDWTVVGIEEGRTGIVIEDCEIDGLGTSGWPEGGTTGIQGEGVTVRRCDIHSVGDAMKAGSDTVFEDNWVHDLAAAGEPHYDGFQFDGGGGNVVVRHNTISMPDQTGAVNIGNTFGPISNVLVEDNLLSGGTYTVYVDAVHGSDPITGVQLINNRFGWHQYGAVLVRNVTLAASSGNVDHETGAPIVID